MMKTVMTRADIESGYRETTDLGELIRILESEFSVRGHVICQFKLNGMNLSDADEQRLARVTLKEVDLIEIESDSPTALLFGLLDNWILELPKLMENTDLLTKEIRFKGIEGHLKSFVELIDSCQFLMESLLSLERIIAVSTIDRNEWQNAEKLTVRAIGQALTAFEKKDFVLLAEVLEYDLAHSLQTWLEQIGRLNLSLREENAKNPEGFANHVFNRKAQP